MEDNRDLFSRALGRTDVIAIGFGTIVGWSWITLGCIWVTQAGMLGAVAAFVAGGAVALLVGLMYSELTSMMPVAGGGFVFAYRAFGRRAAFAMGWILTLAYAGVAAWEGIALSTALDALVVIPKFVPLWEIAGYQVNLTWALVGSIGALIITIMNLRGVRPAMIFQVMGSAIAFVLVLMFFLGGITFGSVENAGDMFTGINGFFYVFLTVPAMMIGFDVIPQSAEELNMEPKETGHMLIVCIVISIIWYCLLIVGIALGAPQEVRNFGELPVAEVASYMYSSSAFSSIAVIGGIAGILTTWNGFFMGITRLLMSMARAGMMPAVFARKGKRSNAPPAAVLTAGAICCASPFLGKNALLWLVDISGICSIISYMIISIIFIKLRNSEPEQLRPYTAKISNRQSYVVLAIILAYCALMVFGLFYNENRYPELCIILLWIALGILMYLITRRYREELTVQQAEYRIFGYRYARNDIGEKNGAGGAVNE